MSRDYNCKCRGYPIRSVLLSSAGFEGRGTRAILSTLITSVEHAKIRPCDGETCENVFVTDPEGPFYRC